MPPEALTGPGARGVDMAPPEVGPAGWPVADQLVPGPRTQLPAERGRGQQLELASPAGWRGGAWYPGHWQAGSIPMEQPGIPKGCQLVPYVWNSLVPRPL